MKLTLIAMKKYADHRKVEAKDRKNVVKLYAVCSVRSFSIKHFGRECPDSCKEV